jgi:hypothetical protein
VAATIVIDMTRLSPTRTLIVGMAVLALATIFRIPGASSDVQLRHVDGGPDYYSQFSNPLPSHPDYFPIGVWLQDVLRQNDIDLDKDAGINLYVGLTANSNLALIQRSSMRVILQQSEWRENRIAMNSPAVAGWELADEIDMTQGPGRGYTTISSIVAQLPKDGRLRYNNYGKGVMFWQTDTEAARFVNEFQDVVSNDVYWFTDPTYKDSMVVRWLNDGKPLSMAQIRRAANYGYTVDRMRTLDATDGIRRPVWNFIEVGWPYTETAAQGARTIAPAEVRAAVWHSIIAGARGIIYFNHSFNGPNLSHHVLRDPPYRSVREIVRSTNRLIAQLAPVLNASFADGFAIADTSVRIMTKFHRDRYFVFAGSKENAASIATISLKGFNSGTATVIGENRTIPISNGRFSDNFEDGNAIHIYRIDSQSTGERP